MYLDDVGLRFRHLLDVCVKIAVHTSVHVVRAVEIKPPKAPPKKKKSKEEIEAGIALILAILRII